MARTRVLIEEARQHRRRRRRWTALAMASGVALGAGLFAALGGSSRPPSAPVSSVQGFFDRHGAGSWTSQQTSTGSAVAATVAGSCTVRISGPTGSPAVSALSLVCNPPDALHEVAVPFDEVDLAWATVKRFDASDYGRVLQVRTAAAASGLSTFGIRKVGTPAVEAPTLTLRVNSSLDPVLDLSISDPLVGR